MCVDLQIIRERSNRTVLSRQVNVVAVDVAGRVVVRVEDRANRDKMDVRRVRGNRTDKQVAESLGEDHDAQRRRIDLAVRRERRIEVERFADGANRAVERRQIDVPADDIRRCVLLRSEQRTGRAQVNVTGGCLDAVEIQVADAVDEDASARRRVEFSAALHVEEVSESTDVRAGRQRDVDRGDVEHRRGYVVEGIENRALCIEDRVGGRRDRADDQIPLLNDDLHIAARVDLRDEEVGD